MCDNFKTVGDRLSVLLLITNKKSHTSFDWYRQRWPWMTLNGVIALILLYFTAFDSFASLLRHNG